MEINNNVIDKIFDIDKSAHKMALAAENEKENAIDEYNRKKECFDKKIDEEYISKYEQECKKIDEQIISEKNTYINDMHNAKCKLTEKYNDSMEEWIQTIVKEIIEV